MATDHRAEISVRIKAVIDESGQEFRMVVIEIGTEKYKTPSQDRLR